MGCEQRENQSEVNDGTYRCKRELRERKRTIAKAIACVSELQLYMMVLIKCERELP